MSTVNENNCLETLISSFQSVKVGGKSFCYDSVVPNDLSALSTPGLQIKGKHIPLPLTDYAVSHLFTDLEGGAIKRAPFGRGEATVTDLNVRKTWQVEPQHISFLNEEFNDAVQTLTKRFVTTRLSGTSHLLTSGVKRVEAKLHKLLIYGEGDH